jgi:hypothetical protein
MPPRGYRSPIKQSVVRRVVRAAQQAGVTVDRVEIDTKTGKICIIGKSRTPAKSLKNNPCGGVAVGKGS